MYAVPLVAPQPITVIDMTHDSCVCPGLIAPDIPELPNMATSFSDPRLTGVMYSSSAEYNTDSFAPQLAGERGSDFIFQQAGAW